MSFLKTKATAQPRRLKEEEGTIGRNGQGQKRGDSDSRVSCSHRGESGAAYYLEN